MYDSFVDSVLRVPVLRNSINRTVENTHSLNLVDVGWEEKLTSSSVYDRYKSQRVRFSRGKLNENNVSVRHVIDFEDVFNVVVGGLWSFDVSSDFDKCNSLICRYSPPLSTMGKAMGDCGAKTFCDNARFFVDHCIPGGCHVCRNVPHRQLNDWCVESTKIFDGEKLFKATKGQIMYALGPGTLGGILNVKVTTRVSYNDNYKLSGKCYSMILFKETALHVSVDDVELYSLPSTETEVPSHFDKKQLTFVQE